MNLRQLIGLEQKPEPTKLFGKIIGHDNIKRLVAMSLETNFSPDSRPVHMLLHGKPGTAKTMFLTALRDRFSSTSEYVVGGDTTKAGLFDLLWDVRKKVRYVLIDEIEYMTKRDQTILLNGLETGIFREVKRSAMRQMELRIQVFASCNNYSKLLEPLRTRLLCKEVPAYDYQQFETVTIGRLLNEHKHMKADFAALIANKVWSKQGEDSNVRDCVRVAAMAKTEDEIDFVVEEI